MKAKGFTLIELIVVIVILGILAVNAAPKFIDLQRDARIGVLQGIKGAIQSANQMVHGYAVIHGIDQISLSDASDWKQVMVKFDGNNIVRVPSNQNDESTVFFLDYGYIGVTNSKTRNTGLAQVLGKKAGESASGNNVLNISSADKAAADKAKCDTNDSSIDFCYTSPVNSGNTKEQHKFAYLILKGFQADQCSLKYEVAKKNSDTKEITPPKITLITTGC